MVRFWEKALFSSGRGEPYETSLRLFRSIQFNIPERSLCHVEEEINQRSLCSERRIGMRAHEIYPDRAPGRDCDHCDFLAAMLMPALSRARESAYAGACQSNFRQQGVAYFLYAHDNKDNYPAYNEWEVGLKASVEVILVSQYMGKPNAVRKQFRTTGSQAFYCPGRRCDLGGAEYTTTGAPHSKFFVDSNAWQTMKFTHLKKPSQSLHRFDTISNDNRGTDGALRIYGRGMPSDTMHIAFTHHNKANLRLAPKTGQLDLV